VIGGEREGGGERAGWVGDAVSSRNCERARAPVDAARTDGRRSPWIGVTHRGPQKTVEMMIAHAPAHVHAYARPRTHLFPEGRP
jgi:hypothetical protein